MTSAQARERVERHLLSKGYSRKEGQKHTYLVHPDGSARYMLDQPNNQAPEALRVGLGEREPRRLAHRRGEATRRIGGERANHLHMRRARHRPGLSTAWAY